MKSKPNVLSNSRITRVLASVLASMLVVTITINRVEAAGGDLDTSFGTGGLVTTDLGAQEGAQAVAIQPDGRIVIGVHSSLYDGVSDFILMRYNADGTVDTSFGIGGLVRTEFLGFGGFIYSVKVDSQGRILAAGLIYQSSPPQDANSDFALARYTPSGSLDTSFGSQGKVIRDNSLNDYATEIAIQKDGKIVVAGTSDTPNNSYDFAIFRLTSNGSQDLTFAGGNIVLTDFHNTAEFIKAIVLQSDGRIVAGGHTVRNFYTRTFALARYNTNGTLDTTFGGDGKVTTSISGLDYCSDLLIRPMPFFTPFGEQIITVGTISKSSSGGFAMACYLSDGSLNQSFGAGGIVITDFSGERDSARCAVRQPDGKIVLAGYSYGPLTAYHFALARYNSNGTLDSSFGIGGKVITDFGNSRIEALALNSQAEIVAAGRANGDIAIAKYLP